MPNSTESQCGMDPCPWVRSLAEIAKAGKGGEELRLRVVTSSLVLSLMLRCIHIPRRSRCSADPVLVSECRESAGDELNALPGG
ncbi:hypothetical protein VTN31DRAFT_6925 [Thermomyces dupontii]|uniref:uncharacterized protein n=1 Tax=Talaromyces thermophilus TaxID=28565 RepID=UPI0037425207